MKFKEFHVLTGSKLLTKHCLDHAKTIGFKITNSNNYETGIVTFSNGHCISFLGPNEVATDCASVSVEDFFKLTPEDVRVEQERFNVCFSYNTPSDYSNTRCMLTQDQIDRIKAIMNEGQS